MQVFTNNVGWRAQAGLGDRSIRENRIPCVPGAWLYLVCGCRSVCVEMFVVQKLRGMEKEFFVKGLVHSENGAKQLERTGASRGDSEAIKEQNQKLRKMGMPADDEDPEIYVGDILDKATLEEPMDQVRRVRR